MIATCISILTNVFKKDCGENIAEKGFKYVVESYIYVYVGRVAGSELRIRIVKARCVATIYARTHVCTSRNEKMYSVIYFHFLTLLFTYGSLFYLQKSRTVFKMKLKLLITKTKSDSKHRDY